MDLLETIKQDVQEYEIDYNKEKQELSTILYNLLKENSINIFSDDIKLQKKLHEMGADDKEIFKLCLMTKVTGFEVLIRKDERTQQIDLERFIHNAEKQTGFNRNEVMKLTEAIAYSIGIYFKQDCAENISEYYLAEKPYIFPESFYEKDLEPFKKLMRKQYLSEDDIDALDFGKLEPLVTAGIPKAKYYMGYCILHSIGREENLESGIRLIEEAASAGDTEAAAALGDYYFKNGTKDWKKAYDYYTGLGSLALNKARRTNVLCIINNRRFNLKLLIFSGILYMFMLGLFIIKPCSEIYSVHCILGGISNSCGLIVLLYGFCHYSRDPFGDYYTIPLLLFIIWTLYMAMRFLY